MIHVACLPLALIASVLAVGQTMESTIAYDTPTTNHYLRPPFGAYETIGAQFKGTSAPHAFGNGGHWEAGPLRSWMDGR